MKLSLKYRVLAAVVIALLGFAILLFSFATNTFETAKAHKPSKVAVLNIANYQDHVSLSWQPVSKNVVRYQIEMKMQDGTWECVEEVDADTTSCSFPLDYNDTYYFRVRAVNEEEFSSLDGPVTKTAYGGYSKSEKIVLTKPKKPEQPQITKTAASDGTNIVSWTKSKSNVGEKVHYKVTYSALRNDSSSMTDTKIEEIDTTKTTAEVPVLAAAQQQIQVTAYYDYEGETYTSDTSELNLDFLYYLYNMEKQYKEHHFRYNGGASLGSYEHSLATSRLTNCAQFVSWAMQDYGLLPHGQCIWLSTRINGKGASYIKNSDQVEVMYPGRSTASLDLQPGDICGYAWRKGGVHTMVYVGRDASGQRLWYSAGPGDVADSYVGPRHKNSYNNRTVHVLIRPKN